MARVQHRVLRLAAFVVFAILLCAGAFGSVSRVQAGEDPKTGLMKMAIDIAKSVFRNLAIEGIILGEHALGTLLINYQRTAKDMIKRLNRLCEGRLQAPDLVAEGVPQHWRVVLA